MDFQKFIEKAKLANIEDIEFYCSESKTLSIALFNGEVEKSSVHNDNVISVRAIYNGKMSYMSFEDENIDMDELIKKLKENANSLTTLEEFEIFGGSDSYPELEKVEGGFEKVSMAEKVALLKETEKVAKSLDPRIVLLPSCSYNESYGKTTIVNSKGLNISKSVSFGYLLLGAIAKEGDSTQEGFEIKIALKYDELDPTALAKKAVEKAISMLGAGPVESKTYPVIIENEAMSDLLGGFSSMFTGEAAVKKLTSLVGKEGEKIMQDNVTIVDDPLLSGAVNSQPFDDEGVACYKKNVVEKGVFKTFLHNLKTAKTFNTTSTGNGVKSGSIGTSGINLFIEKGQKSKEELIASIDEGLLITDLSGLHAGLNPISGDFSAQSSGYYIKNGKIEKPVTLIVVSGNFIKMMNEIDEIGSDLYLSYSGVGAPSIKFKGLPVSGK